MYSIISTFCHNYSASYSDPNFPTPVKAEWPQYSEADRKYLYFRDTPSVKQVTGEEQDKYEFWSDVFPSIANPSEEAADEFDEDMDISEEG